MSTDTEKDNYLVLAGISKDKKTLITVHQTSDFRQIASLMIDDNLEISCLKRVNDNLIIAGGKDNIHFFEFDSKASKLKVFNLNAFETGDLVQTIVGNDKTFYAVTIKGLINILKIEMSK